MAKEFTAAEIQDRVWKRCGVPRMFAGLDIEDMEASDPEYKRTLDLVRELAYEKLASSDFIRNPVFVALVGTFGTGKTRIAANLLKIAYHGAAKRNTSNTSGSKRPYMISARGLAELRFRIADDEIKEDERRAKLERVRRSTFLVLDDIGRLTGFKGELDYVEDLVDMRWGDMLSTVVTSSSTFENFPERLQDILAGYFATYVFVNKSYRGR